VSAEKVGFAEVAGAKIHYEVEGSGHPIVLIHQQGVDRRVWDDQGPAFSKRYTVVRYDRRHWGKTQVEDEDYPAPDVPDLDDMKQWLEDQPPSPAPYEDLRGLLDHLGIERAHLLGLRDGGEVALEFALEYPERVSGLVLVDTVVASAGSPQLFESMVERGVEKAAQLQGVLEDAFREKDLTAIVDWSLDDPSYTASTEATRRRLRQIFADNASSNLFSRDYNVRRMSPPPGERLGSVEAPTLLVLTGERDPDVREFDRALATGIKRSTSRTIPDASPAVNMDRPEEFNRIVMNFLDNL
jgi:pimeloyl-ACP methyl ester carboxylesterase